MIDANPKDKTLTGTLSDKLLEYLKDLRTKVDLDDNSRANWKLKMVAAQNQRLGIKRRKNTPYLNAPDIPLPETEIKMNL